MCFSAPASFVAAGLTGTIGIVTLSRVSEPRQLAFAAAPLLFAVQQCIEGLLWLNLSLAPDAQTSRILTFSYLFFAEAFWPVFVPMAVLLIEPSARRRILMMACLGAGTGVGGYLLWWILEHPHLATIQNYHIVYGTGYRQPAVVSALYLAATGLPLLLSSQRTVVVLGRIILAGLVVAYALYWEAFISVWCFFAAIASVAILYHFEWSRRSSLRREGA